MCRDNGSQKKHEACSLENLAPELLLGIVTQLPDLSSLDCLLRASPAVFRLFNEYAVTIIEAILSSGFTHGHIRVIIRIVALIRSATLPIESLADFQSNVTHESMYYRVRPSPKGFAPELLASSTRPAILRSILATNRQISCRAVDYLTSHLKRFKTLKPMHLVGIPRRPYPLELVQYLPEGHFGTKSKQFKVKDVGPPSWVEEQRVIRAFWRLQVTQDLRRSGARSMLDWPKEDIRRLNSEDLLSLFYGNDLFPRTQRQRDRYHIHPEFDELYSVIGYIEGLKDNTPSCTGHSGKGWLGPNNQELKRPWPTASPSGKDWKKLVSAAPASVTYRSLKWPWPATIWGPYGSYTPFQFTGFERFGNLGFPFWDYERLWEYGLLAPPKNGPKNRAHFYHFAWESVLGIDEIKEVDRKYKEYEEQWPPRPLND